MDKIVNIKKTLPKLCALAAFSFLISISLTQSVVVSFAIATVSSALFQISIQNSGTKDAWKHFEAVPELIDNVITGIQSGLSLNESLLSLSERGPFLTRSYFAHFGEQLRNGVSFEDAISNLQTFFNNRAADQLFESLIFAKSLGGSELLALLRQLGDFTRQDLALRREISAKQGWVRNSAHLAASAPWILLLLLSAQPSTAQAFSTSTGVIILITGALLTLFAYLWMAHLSKLPEPARIFGSTL
jgi:tight adherence protein B